jgi:enoyl-[acyl-carrier protein] reductase II
MEKEGKGREEIDSFTIGSLKKAAVSGDLDWGSLMMGQVAGMIHDIKPIHKIFETMIDGSYAEIKRLHEHTT